MGFGRRLFNLMRNLLALIGLFFLVSLAAGTFLVMKTHGVGPRDLAHKLLTRAGLEKSALSRYVAPEPTRPADIKLPPLDDPQWQGQGARRGRQLSPLFYADGIRPVPAPWITSGLETVSTVSPVEERRITVSDSKEMLKAIDKARPGDVITLLPGTYRLSQRSIHVRRPGTPEKPIRLKAEKLSDAFLKLNSLEGFLVEAPFWVFENLDIEGDCRDDSDCDHAFHVVGNGRGFVLRNSQVHEFNAMIKANGLGEKGGAWTYPDGALIEGNSFFNSRIRATSKPVTFLDIVAADNWIIRDNLIADFAKSQGDRISYGAFIKGNASGGVFENNLVVGAYTHAGGTRVGLSFGGGGTSNKASRGKDNSVEATGGIARNNIVMYCSDVGLYLNKARNTQVLNNTFFRTRGVDIRFPESTAIVKNNILDGRILDRDGGASIRENNLTLGGHLFRKEFADLFRNPWKGDFSVVNGDLLINEGVPNNLVPFDFCGKRREGIPDLGAIEVEKDSGCSPFSMH